MTSNLTKIAAGTSALGVAGLAGAALAPRNAEPERRVVMAPAPPPLVRTVHIRRVIHKTIHLKPHRPRHASSGVVHGAPAAAVPVAPPAAAPVVAAPPPAPVRHRISTRTSGSPGAGAGDDSREHEGGGGDD